MKKRKLKVKYHFALFIFAEYLGFFQHTIFYFCFIVQKLGVIQINSFSWLTALTYTKYFDFKSDWNTLHGWSLSVEEHFYLLWPIVFMAGDGVRKRVAFVLIVIPVVMRILFTNFFYVGWISVPSIFMRVDAIAVGCVFALYKEKILNKLQPYWRTIIWMAPMLLIGAEFAPAIINKYFHDLKVLTTEFSTTSTVANLAIAVIVMYAVYGPQRTVHKVLNSQILNYIGLLSYSIYLWQQFFLGKGNDHWYTTFPQNLILIAVASVLSYYAIERPFLKFKKRF